MAVAGTSLASAQATRTWVSGPEELADMVMNELRKRNIIPA